MELDLFFSLSQSPRPGRGLPEHAQILGEFLEQASAADQLGYGCIWVAESHFSSELQKRHQNPVIVHWEGEVGINTDTCQLATQVFHRTRRIEVGSAILNIVACGGPLVAAERVASTLAWHGLDPQEKRRLHLGFAGGRFDFIGRTTGIRPRAAWEERAWPQVKTALLWEASEIFTRLLQGEALSSEQVQERPLTPEMFAAPDGFEAVAAMAGASGNAIPVARRWPFERTRIVPDFRRELLQLVAGTHHPELQVHLNRHAPVRVFNLSITPPSIIEQTHARMARAYHPSGGPWRRSYLPQTVMVFLNADPGLSSESQRDEAHRRARKALAAYWRALDGTLDPAKVAASADNALVGTPDDIARQIARRFHPDDRLMLWFDFFADDAEQVQRGMHTFMTQVAPRLDDHHIPLTA